jgi:hypothetical protein
MASTYPRGNVQWAKYFHPIPFKPLRDKALAVKSGRGDF